MIREVDSDSGTQQTVQIEANLRSSFYTDLFESMELIGVVYCRMQICTKFILTAYCFYLHENKSSILIIISMYFQPINSAQNYSWLSSFQLKNFSNNCGQQNCQKSYTGNVFLSR